MEKELTRDEVIELIKGTLPQETYLHYVDYRDSLDEHTALIQKCLEERNLDSLYEAVDEWYIGDYYAMDEYYKEVESVLEDYGVDADDYRDEIQEIVYERDASDVLKDLCRNTREMVFFCDTGEEFSGYGNTPAEYRLDRMRIKKLLGIVGSDYDSEIDMMLQQASYGGTLRIYFTEDFINLFGDSKSIIFSGHMNIAIADSCNGSGDDCVVCGGVAMPIENVYLDKEVKYSYTYDVCGMSNDWCSDTEFVYSNEAVDKVIESNTLGHLKKERAYDAAYKKGGCTFGDINFSRHRDVAYLNNYPCGHKCPHCGMFWID